MRIKLIVLLFLLAKLYVDCKGQYTLVKFENGRKVPLEEGECPNLKNDPTIRELNAKLEAKRKAKRISSSTERTTSKATTVPSDTTADAFCSIVFNGTCYWTHVDENRAHTFPQAAEVCADKASVPAYFPNEEVYNKVVEELRSKLPSWRTWLEAWTGITVDTTTGRPTHPSEDTFLKWVPGLRLPHTIDVRSFYASYRNVFISVDLDPADVLQGMMNCSPGNGYIGVVTRVLINKKWTYWTVL